MFDFASITVSTLFYYNVTKIIPSLNPLPASRAGNYPITPVRHSNE